MGARACKSGRKLDGSASQIGQSRLERRREPHQYARCQLDVRAVLEILEIPAVHAAPASKLVTAQPKLLPATRDSPGEIAAAARVHRHGGASPPAGRRKVSVGSG